MGRKKRLNKKGKVFFVVIFLLFVSMGTVLTLNNNKDKKNTFPELWI